MPPAATGTLPTPPFAARHPWDRSFVLCLLAFAWLGILMGFGGSIAQHLSSRGAPYPLIVHVHAVIFVGWLVLFTVQVFLIRARRTDTHRRLGFAMAFLAALMAVVGPVTALAVQHLHRADPGSDPAFLSVQLTDILAFAGLVAAGLFLRQAPAAHRRLMLLGTLYITDAGFARWWADGLLHVFGTAGGGMWIALYAGPNLAYLAMGAYDLMTRRRLHPAFVLAGLWMLAVQAAALLLYGSPAWLALARRIIAAWPGGA